MARSGARPRLPALRTRTAGAGLEALSLEAEQQAVFAEAGVSSDLLALRDAVEATLLAASGQIEALSDAPSTQGIVGVGIGLPDPDSVAFGGGVPGEPALDAVHRERHAAGSIC